MTYKFKCKVLCDDCGTGYGETGPLKRYENEEFNSIILCDECASDEIEEESNLVTCPECQGNESYFSCTSDFEKVPCPTCNGALKIEESEED